VGPQAQREGIPNRRESWEIFWHSGLLALVGRDLASDHEGCG
jgi:hypothetical protein